MRVRLGDTVTLSTVESISHEILHELKHKETINIQVDLSEVETLDSAGVGMFLRIGRELQEHGGQIVLENPPAHIQKFLDLVDWDRLIVLEKVPPPRHGNFFESLGEEAFDIVHDFGKLNIYIGRITIAMVWSLQHLLKVRWLEVVTLVQRTGSNALPIVALLATLIGMVTAFSSAVQLRQFGANIFIANLVGVGMTREMGPLITAILMAGRSGSAFAAELGTMKISDELDALTVMNIQPLHYLILPRLLAVMITMPLLTLFADICGIFGGMVISAISLDVTFRAFLNQLQGAIGLWDVFSGVLKSLVFGLLIAAVGCYRGIHTSGGAIGVGRSTTASVVSGIFLIVIADSTFVILFHYLGVG
ncbi:MlaE family lipid ABC transporter permease subunit [bacterium]|nr:MlaE family lipid ABC transporter permease subunit [bacterium]